MVFSLVLLGLMTVQGFFLKENTIILIAILFFSVIPLIIEFLKIKELTVEYFLNIWRIFDFFRLIFTVIYSAFNLGSSTELEYNLVLSILMFLLWLKLILHLKAYNFTRPLILYFEAMVNKLVNSALLLVIFFFILGFSLSISCIDNSEFNSSILEVTNLFFS